MAFEQHNAETRRIALRGGLAVVAVLLSSCASSSIGARDGGADGGSDAGEDSSALPDACEPDCEGKDCGDDGCGGSCAPGCAGDETCSEAGLCESACEDTWSASVAGLSAGQIALAPGGHLFVVGGKDDSGWIGAFDPCDGAIGDSAPVSATDATSSSLYGIAIGDSDLYAIGQVVKAGDPGNGMFARVAADTGDVLWANPLFGSVEVDEGYGIARSPSGNVWMVGVSDALGARHPWGIKGNGDGEACGFALMSGSGAGFAVEAAADSVYVAAVVDDAMYILRYGDSDCATSGPCPCEPAWTSPAITLGTGHTEPRDMLLLDGSAYVAGFAADTETPDDRFGFVARVDLGSGDVLGVYTSDPTVYFDGFAAVATDGVEVFAVGMLGWEGDGPFATATATIHAIPHPLTGSSTPASWTHNPEQATILFGVAVDADGQALYASGRSGAEGVVLRCTTSGACP